MCVCGGVLTPCPPLNPRMGSDYVLDILNTHFIVRIGFCTTLQVLSIDRQVERERERCVLFFEFRHFFNSSTYFKDSCISLQKNLIDEMSLSDCITL